MNVSTLWSLLLFCIVASITPGPNNIMILASGVNHGIRKSLPHVFGISAGVFILFSLVGLGFGALFQIFPILYKVIQVIGIIYIVYLAWLIANSAPASLDAEKKKPFTFVQALLFQWANPKLWMVASSVIASYTIPTNFDRQVLIIAIINSAIAIPAVMLWLVFGLGLKKILTNSKTQKIFNYFMAGLLLLSMAVQFL